MQRRIIFAQMVSAIFLLVNIINISNASEADFFSHLRGNYGISNIFGVLPIAELEMSYVGINYEVSLGACTVLLVHCVKQKTYFPLHGDREYGVYLSPVRYWVTFGDPQTEQPKESTTKRIENFIRGIEFDAGVRFGLKNKENSSFLGIHYIELGVERFFSSYYPKLKIMWSEKQK